MANSCCPIDVQLHCIIVAIEVYKKLLRSVSKTRIYRIPSERKVLSQNRLILPVMKPTTWPIALIELIQNYSAHLTSFVLNCSIDSMTSCCDGVPRPDCHDE